MKGLLKVLQEASPKLMLIGGIIGVGVTAYLVYKKADDITCTVNEYMDECEDYDIAKQNGHDAEPPSRKEFTTALLKDAALPIAAGLTTIGLFCGSHAIMAKRVAGITAMFVAATEEHVDYRETIKEIYGKAEADAVDLRRKMKKKTGVTKVEANKNADGGWESDTIFVDDAWHADPKDHTQVYLSQSSTDYLSMDPEAVTDMVSSIEGDLQFLRKEQGTILLNHIYDELGIDRTPQGMYLGFDYDDEFCFRINPIICEGSSDVIDYLVTWPDTGYQHESIPLTALYH